MYSLYRGRSHTKKQNACKTKISIEERKKRSACKKLKRIFPNLNFNRYQHFITNQTPFSFRRATEHSEGWERSSGGEV